MNKKFALLLVLLAALVMGTVTSAAAADIKASGAWQIDAQWVGNADFLGKGATNGEDKTFNIAQRVRTAFQFIANENLKGVLETQIGTANWGNGLFAVGAGRTPGATTTASVGSGVAGSGNIMLRKGYVDFKWPGTKVNFLVGYQSLSLPAAFGGGSAILDDHFAAAAAVVPVTDNLSLIGGYARMLDSNPTQLSTTGSSKGSQQYADATFLIADVNLKGFKIQPFAAFAYSGQDSVAIGTGPTALAGLTAPNASANTGLRAYWGGVAFTMTAFDPFRVMADFNYGKASYNNPLSTQPRDAGRSGWMGDIAVDYTGLSMMTPELFFLYSSGEDGNATKNGKSERMPVFATPQSFALGSFWMQGGDTLAGSMYSSDATMGFWALGLSLKDIKLIDKLSHTVHAIYFKGTNDVEWVKNNSNGGGTLGGVAYGRTLTTKDSLFELDLNTKYQIYDELALGVELGYIWANLNKDVWKNAGGPNASSDFGNYGSKDAYKAAVLVNYSF